MAEEDWGERIRHRIRLEELIEPERLFQIQERYAKSARLACRMMNIDREWIGETSNHCEFCRIIRTTQKGRELCLRSDRSHMEEAAKSGKPIIYHCEAGLIDSVAAIRVAGDVIGYILGAQALTEPFPEEQIANMSALADKLDLTGKKEALKTAAREVRIMSEEKMKQAAEELQNVATELSELSWYTRQMKILNESSKRLAGLSSKEDIREVILDAVEALLGEVNICVYLLEEDGCLHLFGERREAESRKSVTVDLGEGYIGWVAQNREPLLVADVDNYTKAKPIHRERGSNLSLNSALTIPMLGAESRIVGVLQVASTEKNAFHRQDTETLEILAGQAGIALERQWSRTISPIETEIASPLELGPILKSFLQTGLRILNFSAGDIGLLDKTGESLEFQAAVGLLEPLLPLKIESNLGVSGRVMRERETIVVNDLAKDDDFVEILEKYDGTDYGDFLREIRSTVGTPLRIGGTVIGILCIHWDKPGAVHPNAESIVEFLAEGISTIIGTARAHGLTPWANTILELMGRRIECAVEIASAQRDLYQTLADEALQITQALCSNVRLHEEKDKTLRFAAVAGEGWTDEITKKVYSIDEESAGRYAIKTRQPFVIRDAKQEEHYKEIFPNVRSHVSVPIQRRGNIVGVLSVDSNRLNAFGPGDVSNLELLATQCSMMLEHFALLESSWLYELETFLSDRSEIDPLCKGALELITKRFGVRGGSIFLKYPSTENLQLAITTGIEHPDNVIPTYEIGEGLTGWVAKHRRILRLRDPSAYGTTGDYEEKLKCYSEDLKWVNKWPENIDYSDVEGYRTFLGSPLTAYDKLIGVLRLTIKENRADFTHDDELLIESIADRLALSIQNIWLREESKRSFDQIQAFAELGVELARTLDLRQVASVILDEGLEIIGCDAGHIRVFDKARRELRLILARGPYEDKIPKVRGLGEGISGRVAIDREPLIIRDVSKDENRMRILEEDLGQPQEEFLKWVRSEVCFPLIVQYELIGTLDVQWGNIAAFGNDELKLLSDLANRCAIAINAALMFGEIENELKRKIEALSRLREIGMQFAQTLDLEALLQDVLESGLKESGVKSGVIRILNEQGDKWVLKAAKDERGESQKIPAELDVKDDFINHAANSQDATSVFDARNHPEFQSFARSYQNSEHGEFLQSVSSMIIVPIRLKEDCIGLLILYSRLPYLLSESTIPDTTIEYLEILAGQAAVAIDNAQLYAEREHALELAQPLAMMGSMLGSFLHQMRNPLQRLTYYLGVVRHPKFDIVKLQDYLDKMREEVTNFEKILRDIELFASKDETCITEIVDLNVAVEKSVRESGCGSEGQINCIANLVAPGPVLRANRVQLEQAFKLIIGNAVDAMPDGGDLSIETRFGSEPDEIVVTFQDTGTGMDEHVLERCMQPFFTTKEDRGTGLGLSVVFGIVTRHSGTIDIASEPGRSTIVTLRFPRNKEVENAASSYSG